MRVLLLEDEPHAAAQLQRLLRACDPELVVTGVAESVADAVRMLKTARAPDLILADIRLNDGLSLGVFDAVDVACPVVFVTAYDQYLQRAFELNAIDYLLKPVEQARLAQALAKYRRLEGHFSSSLKALAQMLRDPDGSHFRERVVVRHATEQTALPVERVAWITTEHRLTIVVDRAARRWLCDEPLAELEAQLNPRRFFRVNRQHLVQVDAIASWRSAGKGRVTVELAPPSSQDVCVSQESAAEFRAWINR